MCTTTRRQLKKSCISVGLPSEINLFRRNKPFSSADVGRGSRVALRAGLTGTDHPVLSPVRARRDAEEQEQCGHEEMVGEARESAERRVER